MGASTGPRAFTSTLRLTADGGASLDVSGVTLTNGISSPTAVVLAESLPGGDVLCMTPLAEGTATGQVVVCRRGTNARVDKGYNVLQGGAAGMILYNPSAATDLETDNHWLPAIHTQFESDAIATFVAAHTNVMATWAQGTATPAQPDVMASFSSRGPLGDWIKPDVTAPGVQVLAGNTPDNDGTTSLGPEGNLYQAIAGTSMSSPHAAGVSALVKAAHPSWTPEQIKSALMTSSVQAVVKEDGVTPATPFDMGAGSIRADRAVNPTLVFDESYADFVAAGADPLHRIDLNIPSIDATTMTGEITTSRTALNVSGRGQDLKVSVTAPAGVAIIVSNHEPGDSGPGSSSRTLSVGKNRSLTFWVTISAPTAAEGQYFGRITLTPQKGTPVTIPVAFVKKQGAVTLTHTCDPTTFAAQTGVAHCSATVANFASTAAEVSLDVTNMDQHEGLVFSNVSAPAKSTHHGDGVKWTGILGPAIPPQVNSIIDITGGGPAGGYLPLSFFGIGPIAGVGDETITNFNVPTFYYGGEQYTRIGIVSNGYVVIGGGTSADVNYSPQSFPDPARPNNVVAPFWTRSQPDVGRRGSRRDPHRRREYLARRRLRRSEELQRRDNAHRGALVPARRRQRRHRPVQRAGHDVVRGRERGGRRSGLGHQLGRREPGRHERHEHRLGTGRRHRVGRQPERSHRRWNPGHHVRCLVQAGRHVPDDRRDDVRRHPGHHPGRPDPGRHAQVDGSSIRNGEGPPG